MKKPSLGLVLLGVILLGGCQNSSTDDLNMTEMEHSSMKMIEVELLITPETPKINEQVRVQATITQDGQKVKKVSDVTFEIWAEGQSSKHEKIKGIKKENGVYTVEKTFQTAGTYNVTSHTTAESMHTMPTKQFKVEGK
ncbi:FixH family protein [Paenibacillus sp. SYP-B3998]|uniref:FixH family protein n=1 Tax=Paenibacillus sp. SYP-B3998 TaxID=2678564 RepID=A0A6G3ZW84_9BACL|nr:FixH family protein [Paenibacillus sp. SYP-B3998]NEW05677.1 FixH family protein [Paenibacillus sp. SYP-B3998]